MPASLIKRLSRLIYRDLLKRVYLYRHLYVGTGLRLLSKFAGLTGLIWFYGGSIEILTFKKDHCNQYYTLFTFTKTKSIFRASFKIYVHVVAFLFWYQIVFLLWRSLLGQYLELLMYEQTGVICFWFFYKLATPESIFHGPIVKSRLVYVSLFLFLVFSWDTIWIVF